MSESCEDCNELLTEFKLELIFDLSDMKTFFCPSCRTMYWKRKQELYKMDRKMPDETEFRDFYGRETPINIWNEDRTEIDEVIYPPGWTIKDIREYMERLGRDTLHYMETARKLFSPAGFKKFKWKITEEDKE